MSFLLDPPLLAAAGAVLERAVPDEGTRRTLGAATVATFVGGSLALYANLPGTGILWKPFGSRSGREFMLTSGLARVDERRMTAAQHLAALSVFALYPVALRLGAAAARRRAQTPQGA